MLKHLGLSWNVISSKTRIGRRRDSMFSIHWQSLLLWGNRSTCNNALTSIEFLKPRYIWTSSVFFCTTHCLGKHFGLAVFSNAILNVHLWASCWWGAECREWRECAAQTAILTGLGRRGFTMFTCITRHANTEIDRYLLRTWVSRDVNLS